MGRSVQQTRFKGVSSSGFKQTSITPIIVAVGNHPGMKSRHQQLWLAVSNWLAGLVGDAAKGSQLRREKPFQADTIHQLESRLKSGLTKFRFGNWPIIVRLPVRRRKELKRRVVNDPLH